MDQRTDSAPKAVGRQGYMSKNRLAVSLLFLMNGFVTGSWAPKIPEFKRAARHRARAFSVFSSSVSASARWC
jgi:hypothetical protein